MPFLYKLYQISTNYEVICFYNLNYTSIIQRIVAIDIDLNQNLLYNKQRKYSSIFTIFFNLLQKYICKENEHETKDFSW